jgi:[ribosomal protein S18]-alanine N-acetyltransferase
MSAQPAPMVERPMLVRDLNAVMAIEGRAYTFPWTRGNFVDSLAAGYHTLVLVDAGAGIVGYHVAMSGAGEMHLLNLTVSPPWQGRGLGSRLLDALEAQSRRLGLETLWLEVRAGNERARDLYRRRGFAEVGLRRRYYPAPQGAREDAVVMSRRLAGEAPRGVD